MSNKVLILTIAGILVAGAAVAGYFYWMQTKPLKVTDEEIKTAQENMTNQNDLIPPAQPPVNNTATITTSTPPSTQAPAEDSGVCKKNFDQAKLASNSNLNIANRQVAINVKDFGTINVELYDKDAPKTVENFLRLTDSGFYNCLTFHRVAKGFVIQGGDPNGNGTGGLSAFGKAFADELNPGTPSYKAGYVKGVLAMANSGPNTNSSQFFIMLADNQLPHNYTIFGKVTAGLDVVDKIGQVDIVPQMGATDGAPKVPVVMQSVKIIK